MARGRGRPRSAASTASATAGVDARRRPPTRRSRPCRRSCPGRRRGGPAGARRRRAGARRSGHSRKLAEVVAGFAALPRGCGPDRPRLDGGRAAARRRSGRRSRAHRGVVSAAHRASTSAARSASGVRAATTTARCSPRSAGRRPRRPTSWSPGCASSRSCSARPTRSASACPAWSPGRACSGPPRTSPGVGRSAAAGLLARARSVPRGRRSTTTPPAPLLAESTVGCGRRARGTRCWSRWAPASAAGCWPAASSSGGATGSSASWATWSWTPKGPDCPCGRRGCWERFASGIGAGALRHGWRPPRASCPAVVALAGGDPEAVTGEHVTAAARAGDEPALAMLDRFGRWVGHRPRQPHEPARPGAVRAGRRARGAAGPRRRAHPPLAGRAALRALVPAAPPAGDRPPGGAGRRHRRRPARRAQCDSGR